MGINADAYDDNHVKAITSKIKQSAWINKRQINIKEYYFTTAGGLIVWVKLVSNLVAEIHCRAVRAASKTFRTVTFTPKLARDRKSSINQLLIDCKKTNSDFCYI